MCPTVHKKSKLKKGLFFVLAVPVLVAGLGFLVMCLWNWLMPDLFALKEITFWQAVGLLILGRLLFGGFRFHKPGGKHHGPPHHLKEKWMNMTEEDKAAFKDKWKKRWHKDPEA